MAGDSKLGMSGLSESAEREVTEIINGTIARIEADLVELIQRGEHPGILKDYVEALDAIKSSSRFVDLRIHL